jgi:hypothetical protein
MLPFTSAGFVPDPNSHMCMPPAIARHGIHPLLFTNSALPRFMTVCDSGPDVLTRTNSTHTHRISIAATTPDARPDQSQTNYRLVQ